MERFDIKISGKSVSVSQIKGQQELFIITVDNKFVGYIDTTGNNTNTGDHFDSFELKAIKLEIWNRII